MGGNALSFPSTRITTREMDDINKILVFWLKGLCNVDAIPTKAYRQKETHGDIDIVIPNSVDKTLIESLIKDHFHATELVKNGNCWSWDYFGTQIDFVFSDTPEYTALWMNYG